MQDASYVEVPVYARDGSVKTTFKVDAEDAEWVQQYRWKTDGRMNHIKRNVTRGGRSVETIHLARAILGLEKGDVLTADHINRDPTDNRRENLRAISLAAQAQNRHRKGSSKHRGVVAAASGRWIAHAYVGGANHHLGTFDDEAEAARVAKEYRMKVHPYAVD